MYHLINTMDEKNFQLVGSELAQVVMTPKQKEQQRQREQQLAVLEGQRITAEMALPPLEFLFKMNDKPCFPRGELVTVSGKAKSGKTFFLTLLMAACTAREECVAPVAADHDAAGAADGHRRGGALLSSPSSLGPL